MPLIQYSNNLGNSDGEEELKLGGGGEIPAPLCMKPCVILHAVALEGLNPPLSSHCGLGWAHRGKTKRAYLADSS